MVELKQSSFKETDLDYPVRKFLISKGYQVYSEVNDCDIIAVKDDQLIVVELKRNFSIELLLQAVKRQKFGDSVYVAIPTPKRISRGKKRDITHLVRRLELGLLYVTLSPRYPTVDIIINPKPFDRVKSRQQNKKKRIAIIQEIKGRKRDFNTGGSTGQTLVTAYRESAVQIATYLVKFGPLSPKQLREYGTDKAKTRNILADNYYGWFNRIKHGVYEITDSGRKALEDYSELVNYYTKLI